MARQETLPEGGTADWQTRWDRSAEYRERGERSGNFLDDATVEKLTRFLGWFSLGLGLPAFLAPRSMANLTGVNGHEGLFRLVGLREIASGIGILSQRRPVAWLWARVAGDLMDLGLLAGALGSRRADRGRVATAMLAVTKVTALDIFSSVELDRRESIEVNRELRAVRTVSINRPPEECYRFWRDFANLPRFMTLLESVEVRDANRSHWKARTPVGVTVEWDAEMVDDRPNERIAWRSLPGSQVENSGSVQFQRAPGERGAIVKVEMQYLPPGGAISANIARLFGSEPGQMLGRDLHAFKQIMEVGEVVKSDASIYFRPHPAQPPASEPQAVTSGSFERS